MTNYIKCLIDKRKLLEAAQANAMRTLGRNNLELPESVKPILSAPESVKPILSAMPPSKWEVPETRVRHDLDKAPSQVGNCVFFRLFFLK